MTGPVNRPGEPAEPGKPGAQRERTSLAWTRTCLSYLGCSLLCAKLAARAALPVGSVALGGIAASMTVLGIALLRERRRTAAPRTGEPVPVTVEATVLTLLTVGLGVTVAALILLSG
ncbi:MAG TPA: DUF202 domain-containing protein [Mycobacteriales bacterium]|nr:DUF202 domain-containing protein [Mycobacteriales bacterium]